MAFDMQNVTGKASIVCTRCGTAYGQRRGKFYPSHAPNYRGINYIPICKECVQKMYDAYLKQTSDPRASMRQLCRSLDLYWNDDTFYAILSRTNEKEVCGEYITKINVSSWYNRSYETTLDADGTLWDFSTAEERSAQREVAVELAKKEVNESKRIAETVTQDVIDFWGDGYTNEQYDALERRRKYWMKKYQADEDLDIGTETIIRQLCAIELDINAARAAGAATDKLVNTLNTLLGSAALKPAQKKTADNGAGNTPYGVWIQRFEELEPIPDDGKYKSSLIKYVTVWVVGHIAKMLGIKKAESALYDKEMEKLRVEAPTFDEEENEDFFNAYFDSIDSDDTQVVDDADDEEGVSESDGDDFDEET